ncbi:RNA polymerase sigma factor [Paenibacillus taichungensis]|uniref:RNA polymerase sigma factor n=1 Tax=Paenibacillus taichungensis TaxID=484184 RepID=UPI0039A0B416
MGGVAPENKEVFFDDIYKRNVDTVYRLCYVYLKNIADAEDAVQSIFLKLLDSNISFSNRNHEKAWFILTTKNHCKDILKSWWKVRKVDVESLPDLPSKVGYELSGNVLEKLLELPAKYKIVLFLYYFEGYSVKEISSLLGDKESTIQTRLSTGRKRLKFTLGGFYEKSYP